MKKMTKHPLRITADALKKAFALNGFTLYDNGEFPELERTDTDVRIFDHPAAIKAPVLLMEGQYALRRQLLPYALPKMRQDGPIAAVACGKVFDASDSLYPARLLAEGIIADDRNLYDLGVLWTKIVREAFGAAYEAHLDRLGEDKKIADMASWGASAMTSFTLIDPVTWAIKVLCPDGGEFILGYMGTLSWMGAALLGRESLMNQSYAFSIDIDEAAVRMHGLEDRKALFDNRQAFLDQFPDGSTSASAAFEDRARDVLRSMGYSEGFGPKIYPDGIYKKMNMIQDEWDLNNKGVLLKEALGSGIGLPTVLTPALEQLLCEKWAAGEAEAKVFEVSHIFMPREGGAPIEKLALSFGAYGEGMDLAAFTAQVGDFLTKVGNKNHFYIPANLAIAYKTGECRLLLDEKMSYLGGNFGGIAEIAEKNFGIGSHAFMANLEMMPLENKAKEEYGYIAPELR